MRGLVEVLGVEAGAETESDAGAELDVVREGGDTAVVDLGLSSIILSASGTLFCSLGGEKGRSICVLGFRQ